MTLLGISIPDCNLLLFTPLLGCFISLSVFIFYIHIYIFALLPYFIIFALRLLS